MRNRKYTGVLPSDLPEGRRPDPFPGVDIDRVYEKLSGNAVFLRSRAECRICRTERILSALKQFSVDYSAELSEGAQKRLQELLSL